jgi:hypothetical protein
MMMSCSIDPDTIRSTFASPSLDAEASSVSKIPTEEERKGFEVTTQRRSVFNAESASIFACAALIRIQAFGESHYRYFKLEVPL